MANTVRRVAEMLEKQVDLLKEVGLDEAAQAAAARAKSLRLMVALGAVR